MPAAAITATRLRRTNALERKVTLRPVDGDRTAQGSFLQSCDQARPWVCRDGVDIVQRSTFGINHEIGRIQFSEEVDSPFSGTDEEPTGVSFDDRDPRLTESLRALAALRPDDVAPLASCSPETAFAPLLPRLREGPDSAPQK